MHLHCMLVRNICRVVNQNLKIMNKTFTYMLPSVMEHLDGPVKSSYIRSDVFPEYRNHIFVVYEKENHIPKKSCCLIDKYTSDFNEQVYVYEIPKKYIPEFEKFKLGQFSKFNYKYKVKIFTFHDIEDHTCRLAKVLFKHPELRKEIEEVLECKISNNQELSSIPDIRIETYPKHDKDIVYHKNIMAIHNNFFNRKTKTPRVHRKQFNMDSAILVTPSGKIIGKHNKKEVVGLAMHKPSNLVVYVTK